MRLENMRTIRIASLAAALVACAIVATAPVYAGGPLANCSSGTPYRWGGGGVNIPFNPDQGDLGPLLHFAAVAEVQASFDTWGAVGTSTVSYVNAGVLPVDVTIANYGPYLNPVAPDGLSAIVFDDTGQIFNLLFGAGSGVLGFAGPEWGNSLTCTITEGVSFLNGPAFTNPVYARDVMVHEFGHYTNLAHTVVNGQIFLVGDASGPSPNNTFGLPPSITTIETMYPFYFGPGSGTQTLEADDIASVSALYPAPGYLAGTGTIEGTLYRSNGTTKVNGVNVIARNVANPFLDAVSAISGDRTDSTLQTDPYVGTYRISGLTPGADYAVYVDQIVAGGFSTPPTSLPGPEEFASGADESNNITTPDPPATYAAVTAVAGTPVTGVNVIFNAPAPGDPLALGDDDFVEISLPFLFSFCGSDYTSIFINSNGSLTFESGDTDFSESAAEMLSDQPRIAGLWDDLAPNNGGVVMYNQSANEFWVTFTDVPEFPNSGANSFEVRLQRSSNQISVSYGSLGATDGLAGLSCGGRVTSRLEPEVDLSSYLSPGESVNNTGVAAWYEQFTSSDNDLEGLEIPYNAPNAFKDLGEPNNTIVKATRINALPYSTSGRFTDIAPVGGDVDYYRVRLDDGYSLLAEVATGGLDSVLGVFDANGNLLAADDDSGPGLLSRVVYPITATGTYYVAVSTFPDFDFNGDGGSGGRYVLNLSTILGTLLTLGDDTTTQVTLPFSFPFNGVNYNSVWVNSNGNLTFGSGDTDFSETVAEFLNDQPRIAPLWDDLNPGAAGLVIVNSTATTWTVTYSGVPEFGTSNFFTFGVTLSASGSIELAYGANGGNDAIVGVSPGGGAPNPGGTDLSTAGALSAVGVTYQQFGTGTFDLHNLTLVFLP